MNLEVIMNIVCQKGQEHFPFDDDALVFKVG
jgi:hypothetical protein